MKKRIAKTQKVPKNVTLDELARMMADGFTEVGQSFSGVYDRIDELDLRIENLDEHLSGQIKILDQKIL